MSSDFIVEIQDTSNPAIKVVNLKGELDESVLDELKMKLDPIMNDTSLTSVLFNLRDLEFMNSKGIGFIVSVHTHLSKNGRKLILAEAQEAVMDVISLVGLTSIVEYYSTLDEALSA